MHRQASADEIKPWWLSLCFPYI